MQWTKSVLKCCRFSWSTLSTGLREGQQLEIRFSWDRNTHSSALIMFVGDVEVTVVGSLMMDLVTYVDELPLIGQTVFGKSFQKTFGGKGANQAVQCARLGVKCSMVGVVGTDSYGDEYMIQLEKENVQSDLLRRSVVLNTGTASIQVDKHGQNTIIIVQGSNLDFTSDHVYALDDVIRKSNIVLCQNEIPLEVTKSALLLCRKHNCISILNPAPASESMLEVIPLCDIFCPNETELASLSGLPTSTDDEIKTAAEQLLQMGCKIVIVTLGARGALLVQENLCHLFPTVMKVTAIDTVGAGDSFLGSLAANLARNVPLQTAIPRAIVCASLSVTKKGAQASYPTVADLKALEERVWEEEEEEEGGSAQAGLEINAQRIFCPPALSTGEVVNKALIRSTLCI